MKIPFSPPDITEKEIEQVSEALRSGWITTGPKTKELEREVADLCGVNRAVCLNSQTACAEMTLRLLGIKEGDEVITCAYTYTASASVVCHVGAKLILIDTQRDSLEMDYEQLENAITEKTKVIIPVDLGGVPCDYDRIFSIVERKKDLFHPANKIQESIGRVIVMADAAHAFGATWKEKPVGSIADFSNFSFHAVKNFTTAEGGAAVWKDIAGIDNEEIYHQYQLLSLHGQSKDALAKTQLGAWEYDIIGPWFKCNMTDVVAGIGLAQMKRYKGLLERRKEIIGKYDSAFKPIGIEVLDHYTESHQSSGHLYITRVPGITLEQRHEIIVKMAEAGVACNVHYKPLPMMTAYKNMGFDIKDYPNAYALFENAITLPLHTKLTDEEVKYVTDVLKECIGQECCMRKWDELPKFMRTDEVKQYYDILIRHEKELRLKRYFDILLSMILLVILSPIMLVISIAIKLDSPGPVIYKQVRVTQYGKKFHILKFRTMVQNADKMGTQVTISQDSRLTRVGKVIRGCRIDEFPQLINVLRGEMSFVGTRPEVVKYVKGYTKEMYATLLLPAGITSRASVCYKDEGEMLEHVEDVDYAYIHEVLPEKMSYNLEDLRKYSLWRDFMTMFMTVFAVLR